MSQEKTQKRTDQDSLFQTAEEMGLTLVRMKTRTEPTSWVVFASKKISLEKSSADRIAKLHTPREVEIFLNAYKACASRFGANV